jgi:hypothetical protein
MNGVMARRAAHPRERHRRDSEKVRDIRRFTDADTAPPHAAGSKVKNAPSEKNLPWPVVLFLVTLIIPWIIDIGPLRLSASRIVLLVMTLPCLLMWLGGKAGRIRAADILVSGFCLWCFISLAIVHGVEVSIQSGGMIFVETMGAYLIARVSIRNAAHFYRMALIIFLLVAFLLPFSIYESIFYRNLLLDIYGAIFPTQDDYFMRPRWGLRRVQSVFDHPILYGVFCTCAFALTHKVLGRSLSRLRQWTQSGIVGAAAFFSLSSGPLSALMVQVLLISWDWVLRDVRSRWRILTAFFVALYVAISLLSNQSVFEFYVHYFAFSQDTGWDRLRIWHYGWLSIFNHPLFGIGYHEYERPDWMEPSIDMFWLINFVRFGYPGGILMLLAFWLVFLTTAFKNGLNEEQRDYRTAYLITLIGVFVVGWTVHFWNAPYLLIMFYLGSASWMLDIESEEDRDTKARGRRTPRAVSRSP